MRTRFSFFAAAFCLCLAHTVLGADANLVSSQRVVNAVMEQNGFRINPAFDQSGQNIEGDLAPAQAFEILRPDGKAFSIGRLFTSCSCIQLEAPKRTFEDGERAILLLRNIHPTPTNGQIYAIFVQISSPIRATLRFDTFVQSNIPGLIENQEKDEKASLPELPAVEGPPDIDLVVPTAEPAPAPQETAPEPAQIVPQHTPAPEPTPAPTPEPAPEPAAAPAPQADVSAPAVALITLGTSDMNRAIAFYQALGWEMAPRGKYDQAAFFQLRGQILMLYPLADMLRLQNMANVQSAPGGVAMALHVRSGDEVRELFARFIAAGGTILKEPTESADSVTGYAADPDGNVWEISWVPRFRMDANGGLWLK